MSWSDVEDNIAQGLGESYERRPEQAGLASFIENTLEGGRLGMGAAPTGTGKSLAGLVPLIEFSLRHGQQTMVATATKALQDQYAGKDLPFLQKHSGLDFEFVVVKGRSNYVCLAKTPELIEGGEHPGLSDLLADASFDGDIAKVSEEMIPLEDRSQFTTTTDECPGASDCPFGARCYAEIVKEKAKEANVIVVNHSLLAIDAMMKQATAGEDPDKQRVGMLPEYGAVLVDEAHNLPDYATSAMGDEISERSVTDFADQTINFLHAAAKTDDTIDTSVYDRIAVQAREAAGALFGRADTLLKNENEKSMALDDDMMVQFEDDLIGVIEAARMLRNAIKSTRSDYQTDALLAKRKRLLKRGLSVQKKILALVPESGVPPIRWIEVRERKNKNGAISRSALIKHAPLDVGPMLNRGIWSQNTAVAMSATLEVNGDFSYMAKSLGMRDFDSFQAESPFDYDNQSRIFIPSNAVPVRDERFSWESQLCSTIRTLVPEIDGRTMILFTSRASMETTFKEVAPDLEDLGYECLIQGVGASVPQLIAAKRDDKTSVLFALKSFMEGVDIQGDALQLVIIDKLPFPNPSDIVFKARAEAVNKQYNDGWASFSKMSVPMMSLLLQQAVGRLIRSKTDNGLIVILDSRMHPKKGGKSKAYGRTVYNSLTVGGFISSIGEAKSYLRGLREHNESLVPA